MLFRSWFLWTFGSDGKESVCNAGDLGSLPGLGRSPGEGNGFPGGSVVKNLPANAGAIRNVGLSPGLGRFPWRRAWQPTPVFLP